MTITPERKYGSAEAFALFEGALRELKADYKLKAYSLTPPPVYACNILSEQSTVPFKAFGKGDSVEQAILSACYESLEYTCVFRNERPSHLQHLFLSLYEAEEQRITTLREHYEKNFFQQIDSGKRITWLPFKCIHSNKIAYMPWALFNPIFLESNTNPDKLSSENMCFLSTGSGVASGSCFEEAFIHGLSEAIERDATSRYLKNTFLLRIPPKIIALETLPEKLTVLFKQVEQTSKHKLVLVEMPTQATGFYSYHAQLLGLEGADGYGCSANAEYAAERALLECKESFDIICGGAKMDYSLIEDDPDLLRCARNDISYMSQYFDESQRISFSSTTTPTRFEDYYQYIIALLTASKQPVYVNEFKIFANGVSVVIVFLPGSSYFFAVQKGYPCDHSI